MGRTIREDDVPTPVAQLSEEDFIEHIMAGVNRLMTGLDRKLVSVGVTTSGTVDNEDRITASNLAGKTSTSPSACAFSLAFPWSSPPQSLSWAPKHRRPSSVTPIRFSFSSRMTLSVRHCLLMMKFPRSFPFRRHPSSPTQRNHSPQRPSCASSAAPAPLTGGCRSCRKQPG